jgi:type VI secretion system protein ImpL
MDALAVNLREFVAATFAPNKYSDSPMLRGIYFSSATQEGTPIDRMMASVSANFGLPRSVAAPQAGAGKSFFLNRLINDVIFTESELVGTNRTFESLLRWGRRTAFVALALASVAIIAAWSGTIAHNREAVAEVTFAADQFEEASGKIRPGGQNILPTLNVLNPLRKASGVYDKGLQPWFTGLGLYDDRVNKAAKALYQRNLHSYFLPAFRSSLERDIATLTSEDLELPSTLGTYIMLSDPKHQNNTVIIAWAEKHWQKRLIGKARERQQLLGHLQATLAQPLPASEPNPSVMKTARQQLSRIPLSQRLYKKLQLEHNRPVDLYEPIGGDSELIFGLNPDSPAFTMSELYTKAGFNEVDYSSNSNLIDKLEQDRWIFGNSEDTVFGVAERKELSQQIERAYLTDYSRNWERFLEALNIAPFGNLSSAVNVLEQLSDPSYSPLLATLEMVTENTQLRPPLVMSASESKSVSGLVPDNLQPTVVDKKFRELHRLTTSQKDRPAPVQKVLNAIADLKEFMSEMSSSDNSGEAAFNVAKNRFSSSAVNNPIQVIRKLAGRSSAPMKQWLQQIADHSWTVVLSTASRHVSNEWNQQVYSKYADLLVNRYPFDRNSDRETSLVDFNSFIGPKGIEITFFKTYLQPFIDTRKWKSKSIDGNTLSISNKAMEQFRLARTLRKALYSGSDEQMVFKFKMLPKKLDAGIKRFTLEIANSRLSYSHGPQISKDVTWTSGQDDRVRLLFEDLNGDNHRQEYSGDWAWMRLLDASNLEKGANSRQYLATFSVGSRKSEYQLTTKSSANPFNTTLLRGYKCPSRL